MSYQVLARKWRPQSFEQIVGQTHISQTLVNALKNDRLPHALLFTGPRGTGKTSSARILAKTLRCENPVNFQPCNVCQSCLEVTQGRSVDVIEIDGASNNGVDAIRELREGVAYLPATGRFKVYIIDEVHMLSSSAFNALLKTLEEPPAHVIFILATTEVQKIPATIMSRCQRFDFRAIPTRQIAARLKLICDTEKIKASEEALWMVARQGNGSMRDSLSLLDQVINFVSGDLTREEVVNVLGLTDRGLLLDAFSALVHRDGTLTADVLKRFFTSGFDPSLFLEDLLEGIRSALLLKISTNDELNLIDLPESEIKLLQDLSKESSEEDLHALFDMTMKGAQDVIRSSQPRLVFEMVLLRMALAPRVASLAALLSGLQTSTLTQASAPRAAVKTPAPRSKIEAPVAKAVETHHAEEHHHAPAPSGQSLSGPEKWLSFVQSVKRTDPIISAKLEKLLYVSYDNDRLELNVPHKLAFLKDQLSDPKVRENLEKQITAFYGRPVQWTLSMTKDESQGTSAHAMVQKKTQAQQAEVERKVSEHPRVKSITGTLNAQIKNIRSTPSTGGRS